MEKQRLRIPFLVLLFLMTTNAWIPSHVTYLPRHLVASRRSNAISKLAKDYLSTSILSSQNGKENDTSQRDQSTSFARTQCLDSNRSRGVLVLLTVPMAWGTFEPAVRLVYQYQPDIPPFLFSFAYYLFAAGALSLVSSIDRVRQNNVISDGAKTPDSSLSVKGGVELGTYLFIGNGLQVIGLKTVAADKAAFLLQLTTVFVPLVQCILARDLRIVSKTTWCACFVALLGVTLIGKDGSSPDIEIQLSKVWNFTSGDFFIILGAVFYTFHCIRLELYAKTTSAIVLAASKAQTEAAWSASVLLLCLLITSIPQPSPDNPLVVLAGASGRSMLDYSSKAFSGSGGDMHWTEVVFATLWTGLVSVAYTIYAQSYGQSKIPATTANLIYTIQPFFTALIAFVVLGESLGTYGYIGGSLIGAAVLLVVASDDGGKGVEQENQTA